MRPAHATDPKTEIKVSGAGLNYVSRGGLKLAHGLDVFGYDPAGKRAIDLGASTGGFTDVLLNRGAAHVYAVDVGHDQLHPDLCAHPRVSNLEGINARGLTRDQISPSPEDLPEDPLDCLVCDVSFICLSLVLPPAMALLRSSNRNSKRVARRLGKTALSVILECMRVFAMTSLHGSPRHIQSGNMRQLFQARLSGRKVIKSFCSVPAHRTRTRA